MRAGGRLQGALLIQPHAADAEHRAAGEAPRPTGAGARLPLPCPPPAGHTGSRGSGLGRRQDAVPGVPATPTPRGTGQVPKHVQDPNHTRPGLSRAGAGGLGRGPPGPGVQSWERGHALLSAAPWARGTQEPGVGSGIRAGSPGRAGLLAALPLAVIGPAQGVAVSLVHWPRLSLSAVHALPLQPWGPQGLSLGLAPGVPPARAALRPNTRPYRL